MWRMTLLCEGSIVLRPIESLCVFDKISGHRDKCRSQGATSAIVLVDESDGANEWAQ